MIKRKVTVLLAGMLIASNIVPAQASVIQNSNYIEKITNIQQNIETKEIIPDVHGIKVSEILEYKSELSKQGINRKVFILSYSNKQFTDRVIGISDFIKTYVEGVDDLKDDDITWSVKNSITINNSSENKKDDRGKSNSVVYTLKNRHTGEILMEFTPEGSSEIGDVYIKLIGFNFYVLDKANCDFTGDFIYGFDEDGNDRMASALYILNKNCPEFYNMVTENKQIKYKKNGDYQAEVYPGKPVIYVTETGVGNNNVVEMAAFLAHEAQHLKDYEETGKCPESSAFTTAYKVKKALGKRIDASTIESDKPWSNYSDRDWYDR